jgi:hypothetical protein
MYVRTLQKYGSKMRITSRARVTQTSKRTLGDDMDYFQGVVTEYLRANLSTFVNTECLLQLDPHTDTPGKGRHWYCDAVAVNFRERAVYLCEITYSTTMNALLTRLGAWRSNWAGIKDALVRDCGIPPDWTVRPWVFVPKERLSLYEKRLAALELIDAPGEMPTPLIKHLEEVVPWRYRSWDRKLEALARTDKPEEEVSSSGNLGDTVA